ncbi:hypothetical protein SDRG_13674 [Saprolegnia diclina VS20]|uniref:Uncharacterized protein n=1 Tax=Saprolegnia diclina (strain VS20) TaxID=1156394 RepID=T0Q594_SAPDV|nr:hypothetical protein SDRG_13674 [Saprolegnia diclina VS20]EQC28595.1 hypothetical protein SDRG_13674 [Saprolegnia diclina VS20]|eukprot:XP_008617992.1 hypothetical protein SDRG_13674 [Saprolegnia diclina VS20]
MKARDLPSLCPPAPFTDIFPRVICVDDPFLYSLLRSAHKYGTRICLVSMLVPVVQEKMKLVGATRRVHGATLGLYLADAPFRKKRPIYTKNEEAPTTTATGSKAPGPKANTTEGNATAKEVNATDDDSGPICALDIGTKVDLLVDHVVRAEVTHTAQYKALLAGIKALEVTVFLRDKAHEADLKARFLEGPLFVMKEREASLLLRMMMPSPPVVVEDDVDMTEETTTMVPDDVDMEGASVEIQTLLLQLKMQLDLRDSDPDSFQFEYLAPDHVLVKCFVPLPAHSSMLPLIPLVLLRMQLMADGTFEIEILSGTHLYVPPELVLRHGDRFFLMLPSLQSGGSLCRRYGNNFARITPKLVNELIDQIHTHDPKPSLAPIDTTTAATTSTAQKRSAATTPCASPQPPTLVPLAHVPGTIFQANEMQGDRIVRALLVSITHTSVWLLVPRNIPLRRNELELGQLTERIPFKSLSRVSYKRNESISLEFQPHLNRPPQTIYAPQSSHMVGLLQENIERFRGDRAKRPRYEEKKKGFEGAFSSFLSNVEKSAQKVVGQINQVGKMLLGEDTQGPSLNVISQMEADFFRHPALPRVYAVTESYHHVAQQVDVGDDGVNDKAELYMLMFLRQPQVQTLLG